MTVFTLDEIQSRLPEIIDGLTPGDELVITRGDRPIARLLPPEFPKGVPVFGRGRGMLIAYIDDDEHSKDFEESAPRNFSSTPIHSSGITGATRR